MIALVCFVLAVLASPFKSKEPALRRRMQRSGNNWIVLRRKVRGRAQLTNSDRWFFVQLYRWFPIDPTGFHSHPPRDPGALASGRLSSLLALEIAAARRATADHDRIARANQANEHREFALGCAASTANWLKLGFSVAQSSVAKYMVKRRGPPSQGWGTFCVTTRRTSPPWIFFL